MERSTNLYCSFNLGREVRISRREIQAQELRRKRVNQAEKLKVATLVAPEKSPEHLSAVGNGSNQ